MIVNCGAESVVSNLISVQVWSIKEEARMAFTARDNNSVRQRLKHADVVQYKNSVSAD